MTKHIDLIKTNFEQHNLLTKNTYKKFNIKIFQASELISKCLSNDGTIFWCGNGGSASDSMHLSAELIGKFKNKRKALKSISLLADPAALTCISNDFGFQNIFSRQISAIGKKNDVLVAISTSGKSLNVLKAILEAKKKSMKIITLLGNNGGNCKGKSDVEIIINSKITARIQEMHILIGHIICDLVENNKFIKNET